MIKKKIEFPLNDLNHQFLNKTKKNSLISWRNILGKVENNDNLNEIDSDEEDVTSDY